MAHEHDVQDSDKRFVIDPITRSIVNQSGKIVLMEGDHNSEVFTFEMPRYIDGHDMTKCNEVRIHYLNKPDGTSPYFNKDIYEVSDLRVDPENDELVIFSWIVSGNATKYAGSLNFAIKFACVVDTITRYKWGTGVHSGLTVGMSIENGEIVVQEYSDILEQWKSEILADLDTRIENAVDARVGTTIDAANEAAVSAQTQAALAAEAAVSAKAYTNVLKSEQTGEVVHVEDAFPADILETTVYGQSEQMTTTGKNLFNPSYLLDAEGWTFADGIYSGYSATLHNVYNEGYPFDVSFEPNTQYTLSFKGMTDNSVNENSGVVFRMIYTDGTMSPYIDVTASSTMNDYKFTTPSNKSVEGLLITYRNYKMTYLSEIQLELGTEATEYEPYSGGAPSPSPDYPQDISSITSVDLVTTGKNLFRTDFENYVKVKDYYVAPIKLEHGATYYLNAVNVGSTASNCAIGIVKYGNKYEEFRGDVLKPILSSDGSMTPKTITIDETWTDPKCAYFISGNMTAEQLFSDYQVQLERGEAETEYAPSVYISTPIDLQGNELRSLPNGIQDELIIDAAGNYGITKSIGVGTLPVQAVFSENAPLDDTYSFFVIKDWTTVFLDGVPIAPEFAPMCEIFNGVKWGYAAINAVECIWGAAASFGIRIKESRLSEYGETDTSTNRIAAFKAWLGSNPVTFCYPLAKSVYIPIGTLDTPLALPENTSNVWATTNLGTTVKVKYVQDINIVINNLIGGVQNG